MDPGWHTPSTPHPRTRISDGWSASAADGDSATWAPTLPKLFRCYSWCVLDSSPNINHLWNLELAFLSLAIEKWVATSHPKKVGSCPAAWFQVDQRKGLLGRGRTVEKRMRGRKRKVHEAKERPEKIKIDEKNLRKGQGRERSCPITPSSFPKPCRILRTLPQARGGLQVAKRNKDNKSSSAETWLSEHIGVSINGVSKNGRFLREDPM